MRGPDSADALATHAAAALRSSVHSPELSGLDFAFGQVVGASVPLAWLVRDRYLATARAREPRVAVPGLGARIPSLGLGTVHAQAGEPTAPAQSRGSPPR